MNRPPFNKRELRRLSVSLFYAERLARNPRTAISEVQNTRDAAAFARLRAKVEGLLQEKKR